MHLWQGETADDVEAIGERLRSTIESIGLGRPAHRIDVTITIEPSDMRQGDTYHYTFRSTAQGLVEEHVYRNLHPMLAKRLDVERLCRFAITRLDSAEDVYLFHGIARSNAKDERLFVAGRSPRPHAAARRSRQNGWLPPAGARLDRRARRDPTIPIPPRRGPATPRQHGHPRRAAALDRASRHLARARAPNGARHSRTRHRGSHRPRDDRRGRRWAPPGGPPRDQPWRSRRGRPPDRPGHRARSSHATSTASR